MTTKDVYSSRYIDASLAISIATDSLETPSAFYLVYGNRSRANALKGGFSSLKRAIVERRARGNLEQYLRTRQGADGKRITISSQLSALGCQLRADAESR